MSEAVQEKALILCEHFLSVEGEGEWIGKPVTLIRFSECNLRCTYCDTKFSSWYTNDQYGKTLEDTLKFIRSQGTKLVSMTGGEPMWRQGPGEMDLFLELCRILHEDGYKIKVETNGLIFDERFLPYIDLWSVSPKLLGMGDNQGAALTYFDLPTLQKFIRLCDPKKLQLKWVIGEREKRNTYDADMLALKEVFEKCPEVAERQIAVILQPEGLTENMMEYLKRFARLMEKVVLEDPRGWWAPYNIRILPQAHRIAWNNERQK
jgi:7-carboxy-7-deazaguanine synthase